MNTSRLIALVDEMRSLPAETGWFEFKHNKAELDQVGRLASALANAARLADKASGFIVWGIDDSTHDVVGTSVVSEALAKGNQPIEFWLAGALLPSPALHFHSIDHPSGHRIVMLEIPAASSVPTKFNGIAYTRIGDATPKLADYPQREAELLDKLRPFVWEQGNAASFVTAGKVLELIDFQAYFVLTNQREPTEEAAICEHLAADRLIDFVRGNAHIPVLRSEKWSLMH